MKGFRNISVLLTGLAATIGMLAAPAYADGGPFGPQTGGHFDAHHQPADTFSFLGGAGFTDCLSVKKLVGADGSNFYDGVGQVTKDGQPLTKPTYVKSVIVVSFRYSSSPGVATTTKFAPLGNYVTAYKRNSVGDTELDFKAPSSYNGSRTEVTVKLGLPYSTSSNGEFDLVDNERGCAGQ